MLWPMQREWNKQYRDNVTKVVGWPSHMYESFIIVVRACMHPACSHPMHPSKGHYCACMHQQP